MKTFLITFGSITHPIINRCLHGADLFSPVSKPQSYLLGRIYGALWFRDLRKSTKQAARDESIQQT